MAFNRNGNSRGGDRGGFSPRFAGGAGRPRPSFGGGDRPRFGDRGPVEMHDAICDNCGKSCQVPFRPTQGKPVYCSDCFGEKKGASESRRFEGPSRFQGNEGRNEQRNNPEPQNNRQLEEINAKLDKLISLLSPIEVPAEEVAVEEVIEEVVKQPKKKSVTRPASGGKKSPEVES